MTDYSYKMDKLELVVRYGINYQEYLERWAEILEKTTEDGCFDINTETSLESCECPLCGLKTLSCNMVTYIREAAMYQNGNHTNSEYESYDTEDDNLMLICNSDGCDWEIDDGIIDDCLETMCDLVKKDCEIVKELNKESVVQ